MSPLTSIWLSLMELVYGIYFLKSSNKKSIRKKTHRTSTLQYFLIHNPHFIIHLLTQLSDVQKRTWLCTFGPSRSNQEKSGLPQYSCYNTNSNIWHISSSLSKPQRWSIYWSNCTLFWYRYMGQISFYQKNSYNTRTPIWNGPSPQCYETGTRGENIQIETQWCLTTTPSDTQNCTHWKHLKCCSHCMDGSKT